MRRAVPPFGKRSLGATVLGLGVLLGLVIGGCTPTTTDKDIRYISGAEVLKVMADAKADGDRMRMVLIDPRPEAEYEAGHIEGAWHMTLPMVPVGRSPQTNLNSYEWIVVYGNDPGSATARGMSKRLIANGYSPDIYLYAGGMLDWTRQGGSVETGKDGRTGGPRMPVPGR